MSWQEEHNWAVALICVFAFLITLVVVIQHRFRAVELAAIAKGLCQTTVAGS